jgi:hypothetical protein
MFYHVFRAFARARARAGWGEDLSRLIKSRSALKEIAKAGGHFPDGRRDPRSTRGDRELNAESRLLARELLHDLQRFRHVLIGRNAVVFGRKSRDDLVVLANDECLAFDHVMVNYVTLHIRHAGLYGIR